MRKWCPAAHCVCDSGITSESEYMCIHWDSIGEVCSLAKSMQVTADSQGLAAQLMQQRIDYEESLKGKITTVEKESG